MGFIPVQPQKTRELRERYRKVRRRQQALLILAGCGTVVFAVLVSLVVTWLRPPAEPGPESPEPGRPSERPATPSKLAPLPTEPAVEVAGELVYSTAPALLASDGKLVYGLTDTSPYGEAGPYFQCDTLSARPVDGGKAVWEQTGDYPVTAFDVAGGSLVTLQERLADRTLRVAAYSAADGQPLWNFEQAPAAKGTLAAVGKHVLLAYSGDPGGYRIVCYSSTTGAKAWGFKPPLAGLRRSALTDASSQRIMLENHDGTLLYMLGNVLGVLNRSTGEPLRKEWAAAGELAEVVVEPQTRTAYALVYGNQSGSIAIHAIPLDGGTPSQVKNFLASDAGVLYVPSPLWLLTAYRQLEGGVPRLKLDCKLLGANAAGSGFSQELAGGYPVCGAQIPGEPAAFLVGVQGESQDAGGPRGARQFYLVAPGSKVVHEAGRTSQPTLGLLTFQDNLVAYSDGGQLYRYDTAKLRFRALKRLRYPQLGLQLADDGQSLLAFGTTEAYFNQTPGEPLQVVTLK